MGLLEGIYNAILLLTIIASLVGLITILITISTTIFVLFFHKNSPTEKTKLKLNNEEEEEMENDPIYDTNKNEYSKGMSAKIQLHPLIVLLLALYGVRFAFFISIQLFNYLFLFIYLFIIIFKYVIILLLFLLFVYLIFFRNFYLK